MTHNQLNSLLRGRNKWRRKLANNTYAHRYTNDILIIRLHDTSILTFLNDGSVIYNTGGWRTATTKNRLNRYGPLHIYQHNFSWFYDDNQPFRDGLTVTNGQVISK
jgi:hypothetical protein